MKKLVAAMALATTLSASAQFGPTIDQLTLYYRGTPIIPTSDPTLAQLEDTPWWGDSDTAKQFANNYVEALVNRLKYDYPGLIEHLPNVLFAYNEYDSDHVDVWLYDERTGNLFNELDNRAYGLMAVTSNASVPDTTASVGLLVLVGLGTVLVTRKP